MDLASKSKSHSPIRTPQSHSSHTSFPIIAVAVIGIIATAFLLLCYYVFVIKCCLNWHRIDLLRRFSLSRRRRTAEDPLMVYSPDTENRGLNASAIRSIPVLKFNKGSAENEASDVKSWECAICLNEFQEDEKLRIIPNCSHFFHIDCIDIWLQNNANCPLCRTSISPAQPRICFPMDQVLGPGPGPFRQDPNPNTDNFTGRDEEYVVIEIGSEQPSLPRIAENLNSGEYLPVSPSPRKVEAKILRKKAKKLGKVSSMGDEWIDSRKKDERFKVQAMRRSFSMDSAADSQLYLAVEEIMQGHREVNNEVNLNEGCSSSRVKRSFFSFGQGRGSRGAVQPVALKP